MKIGHFHLIVSLSVVLWCSGSLCVVLRGSAFFPFFTIFSLQGHTL
jgi:hypothetical protein